ncbi:MAG: deoxyribose-phosphate aldolase [Acidobacteriota bacterium]
MTRPLAQYIDHTLLKPEAPAEAYDTLLVEALRHEFASVCVPPAYVRRAAVALRGSEVDVCTVISFPFGYVDPEVRIFESARAIEAGADELDTVLNISWLKSGRHEEVLADLAAWVEAVHGERDDVVTKVIIETVLLSDDEKRAATELVARSGADFVKTSTGFAGGGATVDDVALLAEVAGDSLRVKASGGIRDRDDALAMIRAGADRLGASSGVAIVTA